MLNEQKQEQDTNIKLEIYEDKEDNDEQKDDTLSTQEIETSQSSHKTEHRESQTLTKENSASEEQDTENKLQDNHIETKERFLCLIKECINEIHELNEYKETIMKYFEENKIDYRQFDENVKNFGNKLSDYCGNTTLNRSWNNLYQSISSKLYKLWSSYEVGEWIIKVLRTEITFLDAMYDYILSGRVNTVKKDEISELKEYIYSNEYDTDTIQYDINNYCNKQSNILNNIQLPSLG
eukprot:198020_1